MADFEIKEKYDVNDLIAVMQKLRSEEGCPWDRAQTHKSIRKNFIEETYEAVEAIDKDDTELLKEELGDVLLQVVFHSQMESEKGTFDFSDVADGITKKLVVRHPHIFGDRKAESEEDVHKIWDEVKLKTKKQKKGSEPMLSVPMQFPSLMRAQKVQEKARKVGFCCSDFESALNDIHDKLNKLQNAVSKNDAESIREEMGDVLFACAETSRVLGCDSEETLTESTNKFIKRFVKMEELLKSDNKDVETADINTLSEFWQKAKSYENR